MTTKITTIANIGLENYFVVVEADMSRSLPGIEIVGLPDSAVKEAKERIKSAFRNLNISLPPRRIVLNLAPSNVKKVWSRFDFPMAIAIWALLNEESELPLLKEAIFLGELGLDGSLRKINGILPSVIHAFKNWRRKFFIPKDNLEEIKFINDIEVYPIENLQEALDQIMSTASGKTFSYTYNDIVEFTQKDTLTFEDIKGQQFVKRALSIAAAGLHNVLLVGPPGSGKSLLLKSLASILPPMSFEEILEVSQLYSIIWDLGPEKPLVVNRPFRHVHHTASKVSIIWWGSALFPGEVSLAHNGVLFFDELPEFPREVLEVLRQPLEDGFVTISRAHGSVRYPASFMFVAAMNPCKCWYFGDKEKACRCSMNEIKRYQSKISWPLLDRFDLLLEVHRESVDTLLWSWEPELSTEKIKEKVAQAWEVQHRRYSNEVFNRNSQLTPQAIKKYIKLNNQAEEFLKQASKQLILSPRVIHRILKVARTLADFEWFEWDLELSFIAEVLQYRSKEMFVEI